MSLFWSRIASLSTSLHQSSDLKVVNRNPPFGFEVLEIIRSLPKFEILLESVESRAMQDVCLDVCIRMLNQREMSDRDGGYLARNHYFTIVVGDELNNCLFCSKLR